MANGKHIYRQERVFAAVQENTLAMLEQPEEARRWAQAGDIAALLGMDRANVARELNRLYNDGQLVKVQGKPTRYLCRAVLTQAYPNVFFPSTMAKGSRLSDYAVQPRPAPRAEGGEPFSPLETQPGANGTLRAAVQSAKSAVMYPTRDLHTLIYGSIGAGKELFAHHMYEHAVRKKQLSPDAPFVVVNCRGYSAAPQMLLNQLFGYSRSATPRGEKGRRGLLEKAAGGMLCLNGVEQLPTAVQDALIAVLEKNTYTRIGEASATRYVNEMIVATSTEPPGAASIAALQQRFPIQIHIPDLASWRLEEVAEMVIDAFRREAALTGLSFRLPRETLACFLQADYPGNLSELSKTVRATCALALLEHASAVPSPRVTEIHLRHLSAEFLHGIRADPEKGQRVQQLLTALELDYLDFSPGGFLSNRFTADQLMEALHQPPAAPPAAARPAEPAVPILAVFHGEHVAQDMAGYVNTALGCELVTGICYDPRMPMDALLERVCAAARLADRGTGVLLAVDMEPLDGLHEHVLHTTGILNETVAGMSLPSLLAVGRLALQQGMPLHTLADRALSLVTGSTAQPEDSFINRTVNEMLAPSLTFLNPQKAIEALRAALDGFLQELNVIPSSEIIIKFVFHCSHMLERLIRGAPLKYDGLKPFANRHGALMAKLEAHMRGPAELFGVAIPASELAYVTEILLPYLG